MCELRCDLGLAPPYSCGVLAHKGVAGFFGSLNVDGSVLLAHIDLSARSVTLRDRMLLLGGATFMGTTSVALLQLLLLPCVAAVCRLFSAIDISCLTPSAIFDLNLSLHSTPPEPPAALTD